MRIVRSIVAIILVMFLGFAGRTFAQPQQPLATLSVNINTDFVDRDPGDGRCDAVNDNISPGDQCSLRAAIQEANALAGSDLILVPAGVYTLVRNGNDEDQGAFGDLDISDDVTIIGAPNGATIIQGEPNWDDRIVNVHEGTRASLLQLTLQGGSARSGNSLPFGGGILNKGELTIIKSTITDNTASSGGGIYSTGAITISASTISYNEGNGISVWGDSLNLTNSLVYKNSTEGFGGGLDIGCSDPITTATIVNTTISANTAYFSGGGLSAECGPFSRSVVVVELNNVTVVHNIADGDLNADGSGGGIANVVQSSTGPSKITIANSIVAKNYRGTIANDCAMDIVSQGYNLIQTLTGCTLTGSPTGNLLSVDPHLGPLQFNGGSTRSHAPFATSIVLDAGNPAPPNSGSNTCAATDQRNINRPVDDHCDIGAVEGAADAFTFLPLVLKP